MSTAETSLIWEARYKAWLTYPFMEPELLEAMQKCSHEDVKERFAETLQFGTGGLRGELGAGTNRMNVHTVARATRGLLKHLLSAAEKPSCAIAFDSRNNSERFARVSAAVLAHGGVRVFIYPQLTPTPMLSFAVRHLHCDGGIVITASHNPAQYNGYKVYGPDGCQVTDEAAEAIQAWINQEPFLSVGPLPNFDEYLGCGQIRWIDDAVNALYYDEVLRHSLIKINEPLHVAYSPLHGAGNIPIREVLMRAGNVAVAVVPQQEMPDGHFPTCACPNPEEQKAMEMVATLAQEIGADLFFATDPDCDRIRAGVLTRTGFRLFSGNELGILLFDFVCRQLKENGKMPANPMAVKTIVTTEMAASIAKQYGVELRNVLTGFKYIGETIGALEKQGDVNRFVFGFEESCGYLTNSFVRDKDAVSAAHLICEMTAFYKKRGTSLDQALDVLCARHGFFMDQLISNEFAGSVGMKRVEQIMVTLRSTNKDFLGEYIVDKVDYLTDETGLPRSDVITFTLGHGGTVTIRPSGTEPKLKVYIAAAAKKKRDAEERLLTLHKRVDQWIALANM